MDTETRSDINAIRRESENTNRRLDELEHSRSRRREFWNWILFNSASFAIGAYVGLCIGKGIWD